MPQLYDYQQHAVDALLNGKHFVIAQTGSGKSAMAMVYAREVCKQTDKKNVLVVTTASKSKTSDFQNDADTWNGEKWRESLESFNVISWHKLSAWVDVNWKKLDKFVYIFDEVAKASAGVSSGMGQAFLRITKRVEDWAGFTATPGDVWLKFYPYFQATKRVINKTDFMSHYCCVQTYRGFPEIVSYRNEKQLKDMWKDISVAPNTRKIMAELPKETHKVVTFDAPKTYERTLRTRKTPDGEMLDTSGALCAELRKQCLTDDKKQWLKDFVEGLGDGAVMFYNFIKTGDAIEEIVKKALPKGARVWRIDGKRHEIPTYETFGKNDIVLCQWQSGSEALNLQFIRYWVGIELCYSYSTAVQARGRIKRLGQERNMHYYYLLTTGTIEQAILKCLKSKSEFSEDVWLAEQES